MVILGSGPGGYVAALRAAQLGLRTAIVEREYVGGVCLNVGCIPSKALLRGADLLTTLKHAGDFGIVVDNLHTDYAQAVARSRQVVGRLTKGVEFLLRRAKVDLVRGAGRLAARDRVIVTTEDGEQELTTRNVVIATGARPLVFPGMEIDGEVVMTYKEAIVAEALPESVVMIGGGIIGCELGYLSRAYGADVTILEMQAHLLPEMEPTLAETLQRAFRRQGIKVEAGSRVESVPGGRGPRTGRLHSERRTPRVDRRPRDCGTQCPAKHGEYRPGKRLACSSTAAGSRLTTGWPRTSPASTPSVT